MRIIPVVLYYYFFIENEETEKITNKTSQKYALGNIVKQHWLATNNTARLYMECLYGETGGFRGDVPLRKSLHKYVCAIEWVEKSN